MRKEEKIKKVDKVGKVKKIIAVSMCSICCLSLGSTAIPGKVYAKDSNLVSADESNSVTEDNNLVGVPAQKVWTFKSLKAGTYKVTFSYARDWEQNVKAEETVTYQIKVIKKIKTNNSKKNKRKSANDIVILQKDAVNEVQVGQKFSVKLMENTSTGYTWNYKLDNDSVKLIEELSVETLNKDTKASVTVGEEFNIILSENGSTGYSWAYKIDHQGLELTNEDTINTNSDSNIVGAPYDKVWTFKAKKAGEYTITFSYSRPWEKETPPINTVTYNIVVK
ncbi:protease inhibitor I42 family protein [Anaeromicropila herbilytica]|uniref:Proteinase inhibitor I42 chagasin domain-containing protein n=1 Tax=Anaeromicropila herbilytica TaxID=2785025 RepID=A0A7R7IB94_9FIRM|nr:protease inhibitor I42 family protein [Anaeromicropila herbilytica]BCN29328.1 hypothetical protein bsdtb5_06230 [Anaeromicropila herbilytica]